jgi:hypothetical protein
MIEHHLHNLHHHRKSLTIPKPLPAALYSHGLDVPPQQLGDLRCVLPCGVQNYRPLRKRTRGLLVWSGRAFLPQVRGQADSPCPRHTGLLLHVCRHLDRRPRPSRDGHQLLGGEGEGQEGGQEGR